jgi:hypothetical protein
VRKIITGVIAVAMLAVPTVANAAVAYDANGFGTVDKGDVQLLFGWNDAQMQENAATVKFTSKKVGVLDWSWNCSNGSTNHNINTISMTQPLDVTSLTNKHGKVTDWTLNGSSGPATSTTETTGPTLFTCPSGGTIDWSTIKFNGTESTIVQVNGVDLPVTPVIVPEPVA